MRQSIVDQIITDICGAGVDPAFARALSGQLDGQTRYIILGEKTCFGDSLRHVAVAVSRGEIHLAVYAANFRPEDLLHDAEFLDKITPVHRTQQSKAYDAV